MTKKLPASTLLILAICCSGIAACAQSRLPPSSAPATENRAAEGAGEQAVDGAEPAALAAADAAEAAAGPRALGTSEKESTRKTRMDTNTPPPIPSGPPIATDLLLNRILALVDGLRSPNDVTRAQVERAMGVKLKSDSDIERYWDFVGITDAGWTYTVIVEESAIGELPTIIIYFPAGDVEKGTNPSVCTYELEGFAEKLVQTGYFRSPGWRQPRAHLGFNRQAKGSRFSVGIHLFKYVQQTGKKEEDYRYCVSSIDISAGDSVDGE